MPYPTVCRQTAPPVGIQKNTSTNSTAVQIEGTAHISTPTYLGISPIENGCTTAKA